MDGADACHPIPPPGAANSKGESRAEALEACNGRCQLAEMCEAVNVVPASPPPALAFQAAAADQNVPWAAVPWGGAAGCTAAAFAAEPAGTQVCYGLQVSGLETETSEEYALIANDAEDEV